MSGFRLAMRKGDENGLGSTNRVHFESRRSESPRLAADLSRRHSGDCGLSRLNGSADGRPLQPEAIGPVGTTRLSYCGTGCRPFKIS